MLQNIMLIQGIDGGHWTEDRIAVGLGLKSGIVKDVYMKIYSFTHNNPDSWFMGGICWLMQRTLHSINSVKNALKKLINDGLIISRIRTEENKKSYTDYRINEQVLYDMGIAGNEEEIIPDEQEFVCDMNEMNLSEPEFESELVQSEPVFEPEPIQLYGEYSHSTYKRNHKDIKKHSEQNRSKICGDVRMLLFCVLKHTSIFQ